MLWNGNFLICGVKHNPIPNISQYHSSFTILLFIYESRAIIKLFTLPTEPSPPTPQSPVHVSGDTLDQWVIVGA